MRKPTVHADYSGPRKHTPRPVIPAVLEAAKNLRFDEEDGWFWVPAEPGPLGPFDFAEACAAWMALGDMVDELQRNEVDRLTRENASLREHVSVLQNEVHAGHCLYVEVRDESVDRQRRLDAVKALPRECSDTMPQGIVRGELLDRAIETAIPTRDVFDRLHPNGAKATVRCVSCQRDIPFEEQPHFCKVQS